MRWLRDNWETLAVLGIAYVIFRWSGLAFSDFLVGVLLVALLYVIRWALKLKQWINDLYADSAHLNQALQAYRKVTRHGRQDTGAAAGLDTRRADD